MSASPTADVPRLADVAEHQRLPEHDLLNSLIGRWITVGETIPAEDAPAVKIDASDIYEWVAGGFFVVHTAYGCIGDTRVGGIEMIGYDAITRKFRTHFFDSGQHQQPGPDISGRHLDLERSARPRHGGPQRGRPGHAHTSRVVRRRRDLASIDERHATKGRLALVLLEVAALDRGSQTLW
jgi:hypothetical protein